MVSHNWEPWLGNWFLNEKSRTDGQAPPVAVGLVRFIRGSGAWGVRRGKKGWALLQRRWQWGRHGPREGSHRCLRPWDLTPLHRRAGLHSALWRQSAPVPECSFVLNTWVAVVWEQVHAHSALLTLEACAVGPTVPRAALTAGMALWLWSLALFRSGCSLELWAALAILVHTVLWGCVCNLRFCVPPLAFH